MPRKKDLAVIDQKPTFVNGRHVKGSGRGGEKLRKYNPTMLAVICKLLRAGNSKTDAFKSVGIHVDTGFAWLKEGRESASADELLVRFARVAEKAVARFNAEMVEKVRGAAMSGQPNTWQAAMTLLERRDPDNWGKRDKTTIEYEGDPLIELNQVVLADPDTRAASRSLLRRVATVSPHEPLGLGMGDEPPEA